MELLFALAFLLLLAPSSERRVPRPSSEPVRESDFTRADFLEGLAMLPVAILLVAAFYLVTPLVWAMLVVEP